ncbi:MAG: sigma-70 family RNA polymerase sigma factor [Kangiellaceae bacterium]|nr:sigma-70 family RNA polymerase sigma factor [Kangiellaceae bacterium]
MHDKVSKDESDENLIKTAKSGDKIALASLLMRHQTFIYNVALKMLNDIECARDVTQEVLIKVLTNLSKFDRGKAKFTTWIYRITKNHIINFKKSPWEQASVSFENFFDYMENVPDKSLSIEEESELFDSIEEAKITCTSGMLMCLDREQRMIYIIGDLFRIEQKVAADLFNTSPQNFRKRLSRVRRDLQQWMHNKCGLVNKSNPCRCKSKTKALIARGEVDPVNKKWLSGHKELVQERTSHSMVSFESAKDELYDKIFQSHPYKLLRNEHEIINSILGHEEFTQLMNL